MRKNLYSSREALSTEVAQAGIKALLAECVASGAKSAWIVSHTKSNLDGHISAAIGEEAAKALKSGKPLSVGGISLHFYGAATLPHSGDGSPVLACYPDDKLLTKLDGLGNVPTLIVLPWQRTDITNWVQAHGPVDIYAEVTTIKLSVTSAVVEEGLNGLWAGINTSTGITHPSDKKAATTLFKKLKDSGEAFTAEEVRAWFVQKGMRPDHAKSIFDLVAKILK